MHNRAADVRGGFNDYVEQLRNDASGAAYKVAVQQFSDATRTLFSARSLADVPVLDVTNYVTGGGTALFDALGESIDLLTVAVKTKTKPYGMARCLVIVMTDGEE